MQQAQRKPVRFYITQDDDRPIVRTIPVATHPVPRVTATASKQAANDRDPRASRTVSKLVRFAKRRSDAAT